MNNENNPGGSDNEDDVNNLSDEEGTYVDGIYIPPPSKPALTFDPTGPRLVITKIVNNFFKSYANEVVVGPFHKCFNAIVGPNGSGKSNVIDSMLFVFGYRATKIRSKKLSVLIHSSENYKNVQSCSVSIHFAQIIDKEGDGYDILPGSEFVVSRTANKDNSSHYELNRKRVQFKEIGLLLRKHGVDLDHNRFLILQGEVEQIATMKCKADNDGETGMLEYLEDIIGTTRYKKPLAKLLDRVEYLSEQRTEKLNRLKLVEKELETLREPMEEAVKFLKTENTVVECKNFLYQLKIRDIKEQMQGTESDREEVKKVQDEYISKLEALVKEKEEIENTFNKENKTCENLRKKKEGLKEAFDNANKKDIQLKEDMLNKNKARKKTKGLIESEKEKIEKLKRVPEESEKGIEECERKMEEMIVKKDKLEEDKSKLLIEIKNETEGLQQQKAEIQKDLAVLKEAVDKTKSAYEIAETELKMYTSAEESELSKLENLKNLIESNEATIKERTEQVASLKKKIPATEKSLNDANEDLLKVKTEEAQIINEIRTKRVNLEEGRSSFQANTSRNKVLNALLQAKTEGKCPGLYGRLGDLGTIDQKYDVAISTCCGALDNIVVDTVDTAHWCIEYLKKYDIGRATFIALEKQEHLKTYADRKNKYPENVSRLFDLIKVQDYDVRPAFYYALSETLVANDLEQASRIAYGQQRFRVVTLKGDLIETTGTMSGGGRTVMRGKMSSKAVVCNVNPKDLELLEADVSQMEQKVQELRHHQVRLDNQITALTSELRPMKIDFEKYTRELEALKQQLPRLKAQIKEQEYAHKSKKADPAQVKKLTKIVEAKKAEYEQALDASKDLQFEADKLTKQIKEKTSGRISTIDKSIRETNKVIEKCKTEITRLKVAVRTNERNLKAAEENLATMEQEVIDMENSLRAMKDERTQIEEDAQKLCKCVEELTEQLEERESKLGDMQKKVKEIVNKENQLKSEKIDVDEKVKSYDKRINEFNGTLHQWSVKLKQLSPQDIPNEEKLVLKTYSDEELKNGDVEKYEKELAGAESHLKAANPNLAAVQQYQKTQDVFMQRSKELEELTNRRGEMKKVHDDLRNLRKEEFITGYNIIRMKLKEMYQMITLGGDADFEMVDTYDPFTDGIQLNVRPPKKTWKKISNLSGGEKTLSSLALVFALHYYKPSPLYFMDEIDAALDFKNVSIVGHYIKERTKNAQFIIISLRSDMFELTDNLVGIYKTYNCTKSITINPKIYADEEPIIPNRETDGRFKTFTSTETGLSKPSMKSIPEELNGLPRLAQENNEKSILSQVEPNGQELDETEISPTQEQESMVVDSVTPASQDESVIPASQDESVIPASQSQPMEVESQ